MVNSFVVKSFLFVAILSIVRHAVAEPGKGGLDISYTCMALCNKDMCSYLNSSQCLNGVGTDLCDCCPACYLRIGDVCAVKTATGGYVINQKCPVGSVCSLDTKTNYQQFTCIHYSSTLSLPVLTSTHLRTETTYMIQWSVDTIPLEEDDDLDSNYKFFDKRSDGSGMPFISQMYRHICRPCDDFKCTNDSARICKYGLAEDVAVCCSKCAAGPNKACGGLWSQYGKCMKGYDCIVRVPFGLPYDSYLAYLGSCRPALNDTPPTPNYFITDSPKNYVKDVTPIGSPIEPKKKVRLAKCRSPCSVKFCQDGRNKYCSANKTAIEPLLERVPCQHTTCRACRFIVSPNCADCSDTLQLTKRCLRKFGRCVDEHYIRPGVYLELMDPRAINATGEVFCHVPIVSVSKDEDTDVN